MRKLTVDEYYQLQAQYEKTPAPCDSFGASGEHYMMVAILKQLGFDEPDKWAALELAERLLSNGFK
jgi:hypothetical protein